MSLARQPWGFLSPHQQPPSNMNAVRQTMMFNGPGTSGAGAAGSGVTGQSGQAQALNTKSAIQHAQTIDFDEPATIPTELGAHKINDGLKLERKKIETGLEGIDDIEVLTFTVGKEAKQQQVTVTNLGANVLDLRLGGIAEEDNITASPLLENSELSEAKISNIRGLNPLSSPPGRIANKVKYPLGQNGTFDLEGKVPAPGSGKLMNLENSLMGREYPKVADTDTLIHGVLFKRKWDLKSVRTNARGDLEVKFGYDTDNDNAIKRILGKMKYETTLTLSQRNGKPEFTTHMKVTNTGGRTGVNFKGHAFPIGLQPHPYIKAKKWRMAADKVLAMNDKMLPTGKLVDAEADTDIREWRSTTEHSVDHPYTNLKPVADNLVAEFEREDGRKLEMRWDTEKAPFAVAYNGKAEEGQVCVEPGTCSPNALNLTDQADTEFEPNGWILKPDETKDMWWSVSLAA